MNTQGATHAQFMPGIGLFTPDWLPRSLVPPAELLNLGLLSSIAVILLALLGLAVEFERHRARRN